MRRILMNREANWKRCACLDGFAWRHGSACDAIFVPAASVHPHATGRCQGRCGRIAGGAAHEIVQKSGGRATPQYAQAHQV